MRRLAADNARNSKQEEEGQNSPCSQTITMMSSRYHNHPTNNKSSSNNGLNKKMDGANTLKCHSKNVTSSGFLTKNRHAVTTSLLAAIIILFMGMIQGWVLSRGSSTVVFMDDKRSTSTTSTPRTQSAQTMRQDNFQLRHGDFVSSAAPPSEARHSLTVATKTESSLLPLDGVQQNHTNSSSPSSDDITSDQDESLKQSLETPKLALTAAAQAGGAEVVDTAEEEEEDMEAPLQRRGPNAGLPKPAKTFRFHKEWHPQRRQDRFPSVEERIRLYAGEDAWLQCACNYNKNMRNTKDNMSKQNPLALALTHPQHPERIFTFVQQAAETIRATSMNSSVHQIKDPYYDIMSTTTSNANVTYIIPSSYKLGQQPHPQQSTMPIHSSSGLSDDASTTPVTLTMDDILQRDPNATVVSSKLRKGMVSVLERSKMQACVEGRWRYHQYCKDGLLLLDLLHNRTAKTTINYRVDGDSELRALSSRGIPIFVKFGDSDTMWDLDLPIFKKFRRVLSKNDNARQVLSWEEHVQLHGENNIEKGTDTPPTHSTITKPEDGSLSQHTAYNLSAVPPPGLCTPDAKLRPRSERPNRQEAMIWPLETERHFAHVKDVVMHETPWDLKRNLAVWRGALTGRSSSAITASKNSSTTTADKRSNNAIIITSEEECLAIPRCRLVYTHDLNLHVAADNDNVNGNGNLNYQSKLVDAKFASPSGANLWIVGAPFIDNHPHNTSPPVRNYLSMEQLLQYKALIILEGNDVSTGLKWALMSQSVVMMPPPTKTSWAMEEYLEPWVHYVPLRADLTDVAAKVQWMRDHDDDAKRIAERASLYMYDLLFHPDAEAEDALVREGLLELYFSCFYS
jgi:hypothetical protein